MQIADKYAPQEIEQKWYDYCSGTDCSTPNPMRANPKRSSFRRPT